MTDTVGDRLTGRVHKALALARQEARGLRLPDANLETLLLALVQDDDGLAALVLGAGPDLAERMRVMLAPDALPDLGNDVTAALAEAGVWADAADCPYVGVEHVLLGVLSVRAARAAQVQQFVSRAARTDRSAARQRLVAALGVRGGDQDRRLLEVLAGEATAPGEQERSYQ